MRYQVNSMFARSVRPCIWSMFEYSIDNNKTGQWQWQCKWFPYHHHRYRTVYEFNQSIHTHTHTSKPFGPLYRKIDNQHVWHVHMRFVVQQQRCADEYIEYLWRIPHSRVAARVLFGEKNTVHRRFQYSTLHIRFIDELPMHSAHINPIRFSSIKWCSTKSFSFDKISPLWLSLRRSVTVSFGSGSQLDFHCWKLGKYFKHSVFVTPTSYIHHTHARNAYKCVGGKELHWIFDCESKERRGTNRLY